MDCIDCDDGEAEKCPKSEKQCGHHCNHTWSHDVCCWCKKEWGEENTAVDARRVKHER